jgi:hypothetical protein
MSAPAAVEDDVFANPTAIVSGAPRLAARQRGILTMLVSCVREKCALWDDQGRRCGLVSASYVMADSSGKVVEHLDNAAAALSRVANATQSLAHLEPPRDGKSPVARIADAFEKWVALLQEKKQK